MESQKMISIESSLPAAKKHLISLSNIELKKSYKKDYKRKLLKIFCIRKYNFLNLKNIGIRHFSKKYF